MSRLSVALLSREYPPEVYGGAGVHVEFLARELAAHVDVAVHCFGAARSAPEVAGAYEAWDALGGKAPHVAALRTLSVDLLMARAVEGCNLVHSHTWYANLAGHLAKLLYEVPHVMTSHSLEPLRPWKEEQLGGGYRVSSFCEKTALESADAVIAVSEGMRRDLLSCYPNLDPARVRVIHNGIDLDRYRRVESRGALDRFGVDGARPYVVFVGRVTRQKGVLILLEAAAHFDAGVQLVLCAGEADTPEVGEEALCSANALRERRGDVIWIDGMLPREELVELLSHATAFVCPSVYEPFGIVNLEAMACGTPVVASNVGGIPEIVEQGRTGFLVEYRLEQGTLRNAEAAARSLAERVNEIAASPALRQRLGEAGRRAAVERFAWTKIAQKTAQLYAELCI